MYDILQTSLDPERGLQNTTMSQEIELGLGQKCSSPDREIEIVAPGQLATRPIKILNASREK